MPTLGSHGKTTPGGVHLAGANSPDTKRPEFDAISINTIHCAAFCACTHAARCRAVIAASTIRGRTVIRQYMAATKRAAENTLEARPSAKNRCAPQVNISAGKNRVQVKCVPPLH